ncbi:hypothetical protein TI04_12635, partial [Achromatium sp. WMS2]
ATRVKKLIKKDRTIIRQWWYHQQMYQCKMLLAEHNNRMAKSKKAKLIVQLPMDHHNYVFHKLPEETKRSMHINCKQLR